MELSLFINSLLTNGMVVISPEFVPPSPEDLSTAEDLLVVFYEEDTLQMPQQAPAFNKAAALWAAGYFYQAVQLTVNREVEARDLVKYLIDFDGVIDPSAIYSADLVLRNLPALFDLAKGLAPADPLVKELMRIASLWPFSSVGMDLDERKNEQQLFSDPSLKLEYTDRIIFKKDKKRAADRLIQPLILEAAGKYTKDFWPEFEILTSKP